MTTLKEQRKGDWLELISGKFWPLDPRPEEVDLEAIAYGLSNTFRYSGQSKLTVAEHAVWVSRSVSPENAMWGLLHDASEGLGLPDIPGPVKIFMPEYRAAEKRIMHCVATCFGLSWPPPDEIKEADYRILFNEKQAIFGNLIEWEITGEPLPDISIEFWPSDLARTRFLQRYYEVRDLATTVGRK